MSQLNLLNNLMSDRQPHRTDEIVNKVYGQGLSLARVGARVFDLKKRFGYIINGWHDKNNPKLYWYQIISENPAPQLFKPVVHHFTTDGKEFCCLSFWQGGKHSEKCFKVKKVEAVKEISNQGQLQWLKKG